MISTRGTSTKKISSGASGGAAKDRISASTIGLLPRLGLLRRDPNKPRCRFGHHIIRGVVADFPAYLDYAPPELLHTSDDNQLSIERCRPAECCLHPPGNADRSRIRDRPAHCFIQHGGKDAAMNHPQIAFVIPVGSKFGPDATCRPNLAKAQLEADWVSVTAAKTMMIR